MLYRTEHRLVVRPGVEGTISKEPGAGKKEQGDGSKPEESAEGIARRHTHQLLVSPSKVTLPIYCGF